MGEPRPSIEHRHFVLGSRVLLQQIELVACQFQIAEASVSIQPATARNLILVDFGEAAIQEPLCVDSCIVYHATALRFDWSCEVVSLVARLSLEIVSC